MTTKNCLLLYPVTDRCKGLINFLIVIDKFIFTDLL
jgi:hypothetical protein